MELKRLISHFTYRIEPKPGGGFMAHPSDPSVAPIEAPTREELQKKIQENIPSAPERLRTEEIDEKLECLPFLLLK